MPLIERTVLLVKASASNRTTPLLSEIWAKATAFKVKKAAKNRRK
jgi:hypothetical protein